MSESTFTAAAPVAATALCLFTCAATVTAGLMLHYTESSGSCAQANCFWSPGGGVASCRADDLEIIKGHLRRQKTGDNSLSSACQSAAVSRAQQQVDCRDYAPLYLQHALPLKIDFARSKETSSKLGVLEPADWGQSLEVLFFSSAVVVLLCFYAQPLFK